MAWCTDLHDHDRFLDHVTDTRANEVKEHIDATLCCLVNLDRCLPNRFDTPPYEVDVDFLRVSRDMFS